MAENDAEVSSEQIFEGAGANTEDPRKILRLVDEAIRRLHTIKYNAVHDGEGAFATRSSTSIGSVSLEKLEPDNRLKARLAAQGTWFAVGSEEPAEFQTTFDGETVYKLRTKEKTLLRKTLSEGDPKEHTLPFVTSFFGGGAYDLILFDLINEGAFARLADSPVASYEGRTAVNGVLCHVIYVERDAKPGDRQFKQRWYFGVKDSLPRKVEQVGTDDEGRWGAYVLTLSKCRTDIPLTDSVFRITPPQGYEVKIPEAPKRPNLLAVGETAPDWKLSGPAGDAHSLAEYRGKVVVMDFWATWCTPCVRSLPVLERLFEKFADRGVEVLGINCWEENNPDAYIKKKGYRFPLLLKGESIAGAYHVRDIPVVYVIGGDGKIIYSGLGGEEDISPVVEGYLKGQHR